MRRIAIPLLVVLAAGSAVLWHRASNAPVKTYEKFAEAVALRDYDTAATMCDGLDAASIARNGTQEKIGAGPAMFQKLFPSRFEIAAREKNPDGSFRIDAVQTVLFNPAGVESALRPAMYAKMKQKVTLRESNGAWRVTAFENVFESMDSLGK